jgi:hypothetical protein
VTTPSPAPVFDHLLRLTDRRGTLARARLAEPLPEHGYDGLHADGVTTNQGAESTLAVISTLQHAPAVIDCAAMASVRVGLVDGEGPE